MKHLFFLINLLFFTATVAWAAPFTNPDPLVFGDDIDGAGIFSHEAALILTEVYDIGDASSNTGNEFGFYFSGADTGNPSNLISLFDSLDVGSTQTALVNFLEGWVLDVDSSTTEDPVVQATFSGSGNIGFFLKRDTSTFFSQPSLNPSGLDWAGVFPVLGTTNQFLVGFSLPEDGALLGYNLANGLTPVPIPGTVSILAMGIFGLACIRRKYTPIKPPSA